MIARTGFVLTIIAAVAGRSLRAQADICNPPTNSHEAKTFAILSVPLAFTRVPRAPAAAHGISIGLEAASLPNVDSITALPTACRPDKKGENEHPLPGILRPRLAVAVAGFVLEASWIPPVRVNQFSANLVGLAVARPFRLPNGWYLGVRADALLGSLDGPVTCDDKAIADPTSECYHGTRSDDSWTPGVFGAEAVVGAGNGKIRPHFGVGYTMLRPRFQVNFTNAQGSTDHRQVNVDLDRIALFAGVRRCG